MDNQENYQNQNTEQSQEPHAEQQNDVTPIQQINYVYQSSAELKNGKAIASLVLGIVSLVFIFSGLAGFIGMILSIIGTILAVVARKEIPLKGQSNMGTANAGLVCSLISLITTSVVFVGCILCSLAMAGANFYG